MRIACKLSARMCDCGHCARVRGRVCTRGCDTAWIRVHVYAYTHTHAVNELIYTCRDATVSRSVSLHYATVTRRGKFTRISLVCARRKFICRVYTCIPIISRVMHPRARAASSRFHGGDDRVKLARALHSERMSHSPRIYLSRCASVVRIVAY